MRRGRLLIFVVLILAVGAAVLYAVVSLLPGMGSQSSAQEQMPLTEIYYAAQRIPQGSEISADLLGKFSIPSDKVAEVMFTVGEEANLIGQSARVALEPGVVITSAMIGEQVEITGPAHAVQIPTGMVAVAIPAYRLTTVGYGVNDGARVNVIACINFVDLDSDFQTILPNRSATVSGTRPGIPEAVSPILTASIDPNVIGKLVDSQIPSQPFFAIPSEEIQRPRMACQTVLQDVKVMKLGNFSLQPAAAATNETPTPEQAQEQASPDIITLIVNAQDAVSLNYFVYNRAILTMALRHPDDRSMIDAQAVTLAGLLAQYGIPLPNKEKFGIQPWVISNIANGILPAPPLLPSDIKPEQ
ncbi:MAG: hypothetical protein OZ914_10640 [Anaerolineaceae bacterium]|jgi:hypothetical protein|nr:hypothetical protein [Anaerolineaceae bacterium]OQY91314.1 MAG: hypothetical protein B6D38_01550 [Anaerolineae bacterium UTCFX1]